jgi:tripartite-type tricarboxylate transporter receptor subunit TctC
MVSPRLHRFNRHGDIGRRAVLAAGLALAGGVRAAGATLDRTRAIRLVVAAPPGGSSDMVARLLSDGMARALRQPVVVENRPGGSGAVAAVAVAHAVPDGHTLMLSWIGNATSQTLLSRPRVDIERDFAHITQVASGFNVLASHPSAALGTIDDVVRFARRHPARLAYASSGNGSSGHLAMEMLKQRAGVDLVHVPYLGGAPALKALLSGQVPLLFINQDAVLPFAGNGRVALLAVTSPSRNSLLPRVPTVAESGFPGFEATTWVGLSAPRHTPPATVDLIHAAALEAMDGPMRARLEATGTHVVASSPAQYGAFVRSETAKWAAVIRAARIRAD